MKKRRRQFGGGNVEKPIVVILNQFNIKKINSTKIILKKNMWGNTVAKKHVGKYCNNSQSFKEKNYEGKSTKTILEKKRRKIFIKKEKKIM
jgi:hypothetical protein